MIDPHSRRMFLRAAAAASAAWAAADLVQIEEALAWAEQHAPHAAAPHRAVRSVKVLTNEQATVVDAMTSRILPAVDGRPGAHEAGVVAFIDRALATFNADQKQLYANGVLDLNRRATESHTTERHAPERHRTAKQPTGTVSFATLPPAQQDALLHDIEQTPFFQTVRFHTIVGTFALPTWGGNRDYAGWRMLGFEHQPAFQPPFGFYDADVNRRG